MLENMTQKDVPPATVLVVDDDPETTQSLESALNINLPQFTVKTADSGTAALTIMDTTPVHVIITDYQMPGMDGLSFAITARKKASGAAIIMLTGYPEMNVAIDGLNRGRLARFLIKPVDSEQLTTAVVESVLERNTQITKAHALVDALK